VYNQKYALFDTSRFLYKDTVTDFDRWESGKSFWGDKNNKRAQIAAEYIGENQRIFDIGAGNLILKEFLKKGCRYQPLDVVKRDSECLVANLNLYEFPLEQQYDWVVMLGVLQFLSHPDWAISQCYKVSNRAVFTYSPLIRDYLTEKEKRWRLDQGWVNFLTRKEYVAIIRNAGWYIMASHKIEANEILICSKFKEDEKSVVQKIVGIPKFELHRHFEGSLRPEFLETCAMRNKLPWPYSSLSDYHNSIKFKSYREFLPHFLSNLNYLQKLDDFYFAIVDLGQQLRRDSIVYAEITFTPQLYLNRPYSWVAILDAMNRGRAEVARRWKILIKWIPDLVRHKIPASLQVSYELLNLDFEKYGIVALGLGGDESKDQSYELLPIFEQAKKRSLPINPHAGEIQNSIYFSQILSWTKAKRIGHGIWACMNPDVFEQVITDKFVLEVCLSSNERLQGLTSQTHPLKELIRKGCLVTLNTDDPSLLNTNLNQEYLKAMTSYGLSVNQIIQMIHHSIEASYLNHDKKMRYDKNLKVYLELNEMQS